MEEERTQGGMGPQILSACTLFFKNYFIFLPEAALFHLSLSSHSGTGSLTATATEVDGFDLLWLKERKKNNNHPTDLYSVNTHLLHITQQNHYIL